ncbi:hypothetical protein [Pseudomonas saponiphila]|uniref:hypothetical protein n=1 Tax=Pseudomonas saponiphila TaxID=556534 RepID=UPI00115FDEA7|nr:hypothetical protein [Pseudomonas saponiphila]
MISRMFLSIGIVLGMVQQGLVYADMAGDFEFIDHQCTGDNSDQSYFTSEWRAGIQKISLNTVMNCAFSAQAPEYQIENKEVVFKYRAIAMEKGAFAACECSHCGFRSTVTGRFG